MKTLDRIAADPESATPEQVKAMAEALRELVAVAVRPGEDHTENCSYITTYDSKSLECDCWRSVVPTTIAEHLGEEVKWKTGQVVDA